MMPQLLVTELTVRQPSTVYCIYCAYVVFVGRARKRIRVSHYTNFRVCDLDDRNEATTVIILLSIFLLLR